jgi:hypothetical protein
MNLFTQEFSEIGYRPGHGGFGLGGLGVVTDADLLKYVGSPRSQLTGDEIAQWTPIIEAAKIRTAAEEKANAAYDAFIAARIAAAPAAAAALVYDSTGRATDASVAVSQAIQQQAAAPQYAALQAAEAVFDQAQAKEIAVVNAVINTPVTAIPTYTDAQIAKAAYDMYMSGLQVNQVTGNLMNQFQISGQKAMAIANEQFYKAYPGTGAQTAILPGSGVTVTPGSGVTVTPGSGVTTVGDVINSYKLKVATGVITRTEFINQMRLQGVSDTVLTQAFAQIDKQMPIVEPPFNPPKPPIQSSNTGTLILAALAAYLIGS